MNTETGRRASARFHAKRKEAGYRKVTLWLSPEAVFKLNALKAAAGSKDKAADAAILAWAGYVPEPAEKTPAARKTGLATGSKPKVASTADAAPPGFELSGFAEYTPLGGGVYAPEPSGKPVERHAVHVEVPLYERKAFNPQQKTGKAKR